MAWKIWVATVQLPWERSGVDPASLTRLTGLNKSTYSEHVAIYILWTRGHLFLSQMNLSPYTAYTFMCTQETVLIVSVEESKKPCDIFYYYFFFSSKDIIGAINWILFRHLNCLAYYNIHVFMFSWWKC